MLHMHHLTCSLCTFGLICILNYQGVLNKRPVAIKEFHNSDEYIKECFVHELNLASKLQHKHVVGLLGYCYEDNGSNLLQKGNGFEIEEKRHICFVTSYMLNQSLIPIIKGTFLLQFTWSKFICRPNFYYPDSNHPQVTTCILQGIKLLISPVFSR